MRFSNPIVGPSTPGNQRGDHGGLGMRGEMPDSFVRPRESCHRRVGRRLIHEAEAHRAVQTAGPDRAAERLFPRRSELRSNRTGAPHGLNHLTHREQLS